MGIKDAQNGKLLYHMTKLDNLPSIIENGLVSRRILNETKTLFSDVANTDIINKRTQLGLDKYVPFHFHPYSSFDFAVRFSYPDFEFVYICITRQLARENGFKILPMHPLSIGDCTLLDYDEGFEKIDWEVLTDKNRNDEYAKHVKMAECLTDKIIPVQCFQSINVRNEEIKKQVEDMLEKYNIDEKPPYVNINKWF
jgi:hypothetical protein